MWGYKQIKTSRRLRILFKVIGWLRLLLGGFKKEEEKYKVFQISSLPPISELARILWSHGYHYNDFSVIYRGQIYGARKLVDLDCQIHLRFYSNGWVSGRYELRPLEHPLEHLDGVGLRPLTEVEKDELRSILGEIEEVAWGIRGEQPSWGITDRERAKV